MSVHSLEHAAIRRRVLGRPWGPTARTISNDDNGAGHGVDARSAGSSDSDAIRAAPAGGDPALAGRYNLVTIFESLHDMAHPVAVLRACDYITRLEQLHPLVVG